MRGKRPAPDAPTKSRMQVVASCMEPAPAGALQIFSSRLPPAAHNQADVLQKLANVEASSFPHSSPGTLPASLTVCKPPRALLAVLHCVLVACRKVLSRKVFRYETWKPNCGIQRRCIPAVDRASRNEINSEVESCICWAFYS